MPLTKDKNGNVLYPNGIDHILEPTLPPIAEMLRANTHLERPYYIYRCLLNAAGIPADDLFSSHELVDATFLAALREHATEPGAIVTEVAKIKAEFPAAADNAVLVRVLILTAVATMHAYTSDPDNIAAERGRLTKEGYAVVSAQHTAARVEFLIGVFHRAAAYAVDPEDTAALLQAVRPAPASPNDPKTPPVVRDWRTIEQGWQDCAAAYGPTTPLYLPLGNYDYDGGLAAPDKHLDLVYNIISGVCEAPSMFGAHLLIIMGHPGDLIKDLPAPSGTEAALDPERGVIVVSTIRAHARWTAHAYAFCVMQALFGALASGLFKKIERFTMLGPTASLKAPGMADGDVRLVPAATDIRELAQQYNGAIFTPEQRPTHICADLEHTVDGVVPGPVRVTNEPLGPIVEALADPALWGMMSVADEIDRNILRKKMIELGALGTVPPRDLVVTPSLDSFWPNLPAAAEREAAKKKKD